MFYRKYSRFLAFSLAVSLLTTIPAQAADIGDSPPPGTELAPESSQDSADISGADQEPVADEDPVLVTEPVETEAAGESEFPETEIYTETEIPAETESAEESTETESVETESITESETESETKSETESETELLTEETETSEDTEKDKAEGTDSVPDGKEDTVIEQGTIDYVRSTTKVPVEGLPGAITQEMVSAVLYCQDETGFLASAALAQIIEEAADGSDADSLTSQAYRTHNLFGMSGSSGLKSYNTDSESVFDHSDMLTESYSELLDYKDDLDQYVALYAKMWSGDEEYGKKLIDIIDRYQLYRLDKVTLEEFESLLPTYVNPCPGTIISSTFGYRELFHSMHEGIDLATGGRNIATYAARGGVVIAAGDYGLAGNMISIRHSDGTVTDYMHHYKMFVSTGDYVLKGQQIGLAGSTGRSTGIHLHFQINIGGAAVNPAPYLKDDSSGKVIPLDGGRKHKIPLSKMVLGTVMNGGKPPKHEIDVPQVRDTAVFRKIHTAIDTVRGIPAIINPVEDLPEKEYDLSDEILGSIVHDGVSPKHEISVPWVDKHDLSGRVSIDIIGSHD